MAERSITIKFLGDPAGGKKAFQEVGTAATTFEGKIEGAGGKFGNFASTMTGFLAAGAVQKFGSFLKDGAQGAADDAAAMVKLEQAVTNTGKSYDQYGGAIDDAIKRGQDLAFTDGETADALATLISLTGDTEEGMNRLTAAQDLARGTGISLQQAALLLGKTSDENTAALSRMGIQLGKNATAQDVLNAVDAKFGGQAGAFAESDAGKFAKAQQNMGEMAETLGGALIPAISIAAVVTTTLLQAVTPLIEYIASSPPILAGLAAVLITAVVPALVAKTTALWASVTAWLAANAAMLPIIAVAAAIGVAIGLLYVAWQSNFLGIQDITKQVFDFIMPYVTGAMAGMQSSIEVAVNAIRIVWDAVFPYIRTVVETVFPIIAQIVTTYIGILKTEIELGVAAARWAFDNVFVPIQGVVMDVFNTIAGIVATVWGPAVTAIGVGVDGVKVAFDGLVYIQGVVSDIFTTISGLVASLWLGASGGVGMILAGVATIYGVFEGAYETMVGYGRAIVQGLIDGISALYGTLKGWFDKITELMKIDVPGFSPPYDAGYEQGQRFVQGLSDGVRDTTGMFDRSIGEVTDRMDLGGTGSGNTGGTGTRGTTGTGNTGGGGTRGTSGSGNTGGRGVPRDYDGPGFYYEKPNNGQGDGVIGDPAYMEIPPSGHFDNPQNVGGGKSFGVFSERMATKAAEKIDEANDDYLSRLDKRDRDFLREMSRYVERIVRSNEAVPGATAKAVRSALAGAI